MNIENINYLANKIENLNHISYHVDNIELYIKDSFNMDIEKFACGAPACIAGWAVSCHDESDKIALDENFNNKVISYLGITKEQFFELCYPFDTFTSLEISFDEVTPKEAAKVLRHLAASESVDWWIIRP